MQHLEEFEARIARTVAGSLTPYPDHPSEGLVLVVDDEISTRRLLSSILGKIKLKSAEVSDGTEACSFITGNLPDVILLDVMLPGIDGFEVCRRIKSRPETVHIPVLMVSGLRHREMIYRGMAAGADGFISKPLDTWEVALRVRTALRTHRGVRRPEPIQISNHFGALDPEKVSGSLKQVMRSLAKLALCEEVPERLRKEVGKATAAASKIAMVSDGILEIERLKRDVAFTESETASLRQLVTEALDVFDGHIKVNNGVRPELQVRCQSAIVVQALIKLIGYAKEQSGGMKWISVSAAETGTGVKVQLTLGHLGEADESRTQSTADGEENYFDGEAGNQLVLAFCIAAFAAQNGEVGGCGHSFFFTLPFGV